MVTMSVSLPMGKLKIKHDKLLSDNIIQLFRMYALFQYILLYWDTIEFLGKREVEKPTQWKVLTMTDKEVSFQEQYQKYLRKLVVW